MKDKWMKNKGWMHEYMFLSCGVPLSAPDTTNIYCSFLS